MKEQFKKSAIQHSIIIAIFFAIALFYSYPILQGNQLSAGDSVHWRAMSDTEKWKVIERIRTTKAQSEELELLNLCPQKLI